MIRLPLADIHMDTALQPRTAIDETCIEEYSERMTDGDTFPPVVVFYDETDHWLADGYHRVYAAMKAGQTHINAKIERGTRDDALWHSYSANKAHGLRRSNADKRRAVEAALRHPERSKMSNKELAAYLGVSYNYIGRVEGTLSMDRSIDRASECEVTRNGTTYTMHVPRTTMQLQTPPPAYLIPPEPAPAHQDRTYMLPDWQALGEAERAAIIDAAMTASTHQHFNNQASDNIEWARWSWNPVTGCYHDCIYCYARDIANRFYSQGFEATFLPDRLAIPRSQVPPADADHLVGYKNVFTCSMADLFGKWVPQDWIDAVLDTVRASPQWNFLFLTKFPIRLSEQTWPDNAWVGCSVDRQARVSSAERAFSKVKAGIKWLSCEPLLEPLQFKSLEMFDWVVIGGQSRSSQAPEFQPPWEWIESLVWQARQAGCKVYFKTNLHGRPGEYPFSTGSGANDAKSRQIAPPMAQDGAREDER